MFICPSLHSRLELIESFDLVYLLTLPCLNVFFVSVALEIPEYKLTRCTECFILNIVTVIRKLATAVALVENTDRLEFRAIFSQVFSIMFL